MCFLLFKKMRDAYCVKYNAKDSYVKFLGKGNFIVVNLSITNYTKKELNITISVPDKYALLDQLTYEDETTANRIIEKGKGVIVFHAPKIKQVENVVGKNIALHPNDKEQVVNVVVKLPNNSSRGDDVLILNLSTAKKQKELCINIADLLSTIE